MIRDWLFTTHLMLHGSSRPMSSWRHQSVNCVIRNRLTPWCHLRLSGRAVKTQRCRTFQKVPRATEPADAGRPQFRSQPPWKRSKSKRHPSKTCTYEHQKYINMPHGTPWTIQDLTNACTTRAPTQANVWTTRAPTQTKNAHMQTYAQVHTSLHMQTYSRRYTVYAHMYSRKPSNHYAQKSKHNQG